MSILPTRRILEADITNAPYHTVVETIIGLGRNRCSSYVCISNVHMVVEGALNPEFNRVINEADMATPDGKPLAVFMNYLYGTRQERIAGMDLIEDLFRRCSEEGLSIYFYGSTPEVLEAMRLRLAVEYPRLKIVDMVSPPFRPLSAEEDEDITATIRDSGANLVLVGLGCPKQERWMASHRGRIDAVMVGVGGAFPLYAGEVSRAPQWMRRFCLEWVHRLWLEPRRLFKRYLTTNTLFLLLMGGQILRQKLPQPLFPKA